MKKLLCLSLMLFSSVSFAVSDDEIEEICDDLYEEVAKPMYTEVLRPSSFKKQRLSAKTDRDASIKFFQLAKTEPVILKEIAYAMGGDVEEAKQLMEMFSTIHNHTHSIFYDSKGGLRRAKDIENLWKFQCYNGRMEKLFGYLESLED